MTKNWQICFLVLSSQLFSLSLAEKLSSEPLKGHRAKTHPVLGASNSGSCLAHPFSPFDDFTDPVINNQRQKELFQCSAIPATLWQGSFGILFCVLLEACPLENPSIK
jgi:hypothetical protein